VIVRVVTARVRPGRIGQFSVAMRRQLAILADQPGLVYAKLARRVDGAGDEEVVLFEEWRDAASLYAWAGDDLARARLLPAAADAATEVTVTHYEGLGWSPEADGDSDQLAGGASERPGS
jgi:quinol monooxygenase YgiN